MKKSEIVKLFKSNIESHIPTSIPKIDWSTLSSNQEILGDIVPVRKPINLIFSIKILFATSFMIALVVFGIGFLQNQPVAVAKNPYASVNDKNTLSVSAVSTATLMSNYAATQISFNQALGMTSLLSTTDTVTTIEPYLGMIETLTGQNFGITTTNLVSDNSLYETMVLLSTFDLLGNPIFYTLYFNTISYTESGEQNQYEIEGIFLYKNFQFNFVGKKEIEDDQEIITFKTTDGTSNYVESVYKVENNESKYSIKIVENNQIVSQSKIKIENEDGSTKISFEYKEGFDYGIYEFKYEQENGVNLLKIKYQTTINSIEESGEMKVEIKVDLLTGMTSYQILVQPDDEDEYEYESDRNIDDDEDDEDEEEDNDPEDENNESEDEEEN